MDEDFDNEEIMWAARRSRLAIGSGNGPAIGQRQQSRDGEAAIRP